MKRPRHGGIHRPVGEYRQNASALIRSRSESVRAYLQDARFTSSSRDFAELRLGGLMRAMVTGPRTDLERRALAEGSDSTGGVSVPDVTLARFVDALRAAMVCIQAGAQTLALTSDKNTIARTASDPVAGWRDENEGVDESAPTFEGVVMEPKSLAVLVKVSRELIEDSLNIEQALEASLRGCAICRTRSRCTTGKRHTARAQRHLLHYGCQRLRGRGTVQPTTIRSLKA